MTPQPIEIIGGGLAGLSLGIALRREGIDVTVHEGSSYPRHKVCGEFITGLDDDTIQSLGLASILFDARPCHEVTWHQGNARLRQHRLPEPARAISRYVLDTRMAEAFVAEGGKLLTGVPVQDFQPAPGRVIALGKPLRSTSPWLGLKLHVRGLVLASDLELHLGDKGYVGLCRLDDRTVNVCGLFRRQPLAAKAGGAADALLIAYLRGWGLGSLAERLVEAETVPESVRAVAGLDFSKGRPGIDGLTLGDAFTQTPPFTGNGMAMAFQSAACALGTLTAWSRGKLGWAETVAEVRGALRKRFRRRLVMARSLHPFLLLPQRQRLLAGSQRRGWLPMASLYRLVH